MSELPPHSGLKSYPAPWEGTLLLACRKCQKKLKKHHGSHPLANLKKIAKAHNRKHPASPLHVLPVSCQDLCPKNAVTVCLPAQLPTRLLILRSQDDLDHLLRHPLNPPQPASLETTSASNLP